MFHCIARDYTRPDLPTCESDVVAQPAASGPVMTDVSAAIAGMYVGALLCLCCYWSMCLKWLT